MTDEEDLFEGLVLLRVERDQAEQRYRAAQERLIEHMASIRRKSAVINGRKFTVVAAERTVIDEDGLKKSMGASKWRKYTVQKLDRRLLERAIIDGSVDPVLVAQHSVVRRDAPHIRISDALE